MEYLLLNSGHRMPCLGLGLNMVTAPDEPQKVIADAAAMGYRLFDTASAFKNEVEVGEGIRGCGIPREELFVTTKIWNTAQRIGNVEEAFNRSLERMGLDYIDLYLIQWPVPGCFLDTWHIMEKIYAAGKARSIGVSNFTEPDLKMLMDNSDIAPAVNQIEFHPLYYRESLVNYCHANGIAVQASSPLARGEYLDREILTKLAEKYNRSEAQIGLRWILQHGCGVIPKSVHTARILENSQIFDFELSEEEMAVIDVMNENRRVTDIPDDLQDVIIQ
ncbi:MAG: aldo/keto reductase [Lachnospiraceae bacterium]|nr:aldo/keto reductase [Lachnospiraceae bacterium]